MIKQSSRVNGDSRKELRIIEKRKIFWRLKHSDQSGVGKVHNISASGMLFETNSNFQPNEDSLFSFDSDLGHNNFIPQNGQLIWHKKKKFAKNRYLCGVRFQHPAEYVMSKLQQRVQTRSVRSQKVKKINDAVSYALIVGMIALTGYLVWQSYGLYEDMLKTNQSLFAVSNQQAELFQDRTARLQASQIQIANLTEELNSTKLLYDQSEGMLTSVRKELETTKAILLQTEYMLTEANTNNATLKQEVLALSGLDELQMRETGVDLENTVILLQEKNIQLQNEIKSLQANLVAFSSQINSVDEGKKLIKEYKRGMKDIRGKIKHFRREAHYARSAAQKENDRIKSILGNNGYFVKNGENVIVDFKQYEAINAGQSVTADTTPPKPKIEIDVTFVD